VRTFRMLMAAGVVLTLAGMALCQASRPARSTSGPASRPASRMGTVVKVDGANIVVSVRQRGAEPKEETIATDSKTEILIDAEPAKLADLKAEMRVTITPDTGTATKVSVRSRGQMGTFVKLDGKNVVITSGRGEDATEVTVVTDEKTKVFIEDKPGKLDDLKAGMFVTALPESGTATKILAGAARMGGRRGGM
jgi:hypothetical protein